MNKNIPPVNFLLFYFLLMILLFNVPVLAQPHFPERQRAADRAKKTDAEVLAKYNALLNKTKVLIKADAGEFDEHNSLTPDYIKTEQQAWIVYRNSYCDLNTHMNVFPSDSLLAWQEYNSCIANMNEARLQRLDDIKNSLSH